MGRLLEPGEIDDALKSLARIASALEGIENHLGNIHSKIEEEPTGEKILKVTII